jgi:antitoxin (DNA-binding transcriptional repressor) of toxin-antitoxin stability system
MTVIATTDLANQLPSILRALASGEEFLLTDAGRPVARILPAAAPKTDRLSNDEWQRNFAAWMKRVEARADRYPPGFVVDDKTPPLTNISR